MLCTLLALALSLRSLWAITAANALSRRPLHNHLPFTNELPCQLHSITAQRIVPKSHHSQRSNWSPWLHQKAPKVSRWAPLGARSDAKHLYALADTCTLVCSTRQWSLCVWVLTDKNSAYTRTYSAPTQRTSTKLFLDNSWKLKHVLLNSKTFISSSVVFW